MRAAKRAFAERPRHARLIAPMGTRQRKKRAMVGRRKKNVLPGVWVVMKETDQGEDELVGLFVTDAEARRYMDELVDLEGGVTTRAYFDIPYRARGAGSDTVAFYRDK